MFVYIVDGVQHLLPVVQHKRGRQAGAARAQERRQVRLAHLEHEAQELVLSVVFTAKQPNYKPYILKIISIKYIY